MLLRCGLEWSSSRIGAATGYDHSSVLHGVQRALSLVPGDELYRGRIQHALIWLRDNGLMGDRQHRDALRDLGLYAEQMPLPGVSPGTEVENGAS
jgi:hypothetical protein